MLYTLYCVKQDGLEIRPIKSCEWRETEEAVPNTPHPLFNQMIVIMQACDLEYVKYGNARNRYTLERASA